MMGRQHTEMRVTVINVERNDIMCVWHTVSCCITGTNYTHFISCLHATWHCLNAWRAVHVVRVVVFVVFIYGRQVAMVCSRSKIMEKGR